MDHRSSSDEVFSKAYAMGRMTFYCPRTANWLATEVHTNPETVQRCMGVAMKVFCPYCRSMHELPVRETRLEG